MPKLHLCALLCLTFLPACTAGGGEQPVDEPARSTGAAEAGEPKPEPEPEPEPNTTISVASVQLMEDCPDPEPAAPARPSQAMPPAPGVALDSERAGKVGPGWNGEYPSFCEQSTIQLALESAATSPVSVEIKAVRLLSDGKAVGALKVRAPTIWINDTYQTWDQKLAPGAPAKASYKLSLPNWTEVEAAIGGPSFGHMFTLELDVAIDGVVQTVSSAPVPREEPHVVVT